LGAVRGTVVLLNQFPESDYNMLTDGPCESSLQLTAAALSSQISVTWGERRATWRCHQPGFGFPEPDIIPEGLQSFTFAPPVGFDCVDASVSPERLPAHSLKLVGSTCVLQVETTNLSTLDITFRVVDKRTNGPLRYTVGGSAAIEGASAETVENRVSKHGCPPNVDQPGRFIQSANVDVSAGPIKAGWFCGADAPTPDYFFGAGSGEPSLPYFPGQKRITFIPPTGYECSSSRVYIDGAHVPSSFQPGLESCTESATLLGEAPPGEGLWIWFFVKKMFRIHGAVALEGASVDEDVNRLTLASSCVEPRTFFTTNGASLEAVIPGVNTKVDWPCPALTAKPIFRIAVDDVTLRTNDYLPSRPGTRKLVFTPPFGYRCSSVLVEGNSRLTSQLEQPDSRCILNLDQAESTSLLISNDVFVWFYIKPL
jgi:hypothetical protein